MAINSDVSLQRIVVLTQGSSDPIAAKTGASVVRYRGQDVVAILDAEHVGKTAADLLGAGPTIPVVGSLDDAAGANTLLIGTAPNGGRIPPAWRHIVLDAIERGMNVVSGLHDFLADDAEFAAAAQAHGVELIDVRRNDEQFVASGKPLGNDTLRIHTVGDDSCVGKMVVSLELTRALREKGHDAKFLATGQTGIMIAGDGVPIDRVVSDFVNGAAERLVLRNQQHDILVIEGQGSISHPMYSAVTVGLMHGCQPQGLILCYEVGREAYDGVRFRRLSSLSDLRTAYEVVGRLAHPTQVIGVAMNGRKITPEAAEVEKRRVSEELELPVCDVFRDGPAPLVEAVETLKASLPS